MGGTFAATEWGRGTIVLQDARSARTNGLGAANPLDVFEAYAELAPASGSAGLRVGRQRLELGSERLVGDSDWTMLSRNMDGVRGWWSRGPFSAQVFAGQQVAPDAEAADRWWSSHELAAISFDVRDRRATSIVAPYVLMSRQVGQARPRYTFGAEFDRALSQTIRTTVELSWQRGEYDQQVVQAFAGHYGIEWRDDQSLGRTTLAVEYDHASGDRDANDGRLETFDPIAPDTGERFGLVDLVQLSNLRHVGVRLSFEPTRRTDVSVAYHRLFRDRASDRVYGPTGPVNLGVSDDLMGRDIGTAVDVRGLWHASPRTELHVGLATFFRGSRLMDDQSSGLWRPYAGWRVRF